MREYTWLVSAGLSAAVGFVAFTQVFDLGTLGTGLAMVAGGLAAFVAFSSSRR